jgi:hypothetical protein
MKYTIHMGQNFPFAQNPAFCEIDGGKILCNDVTLPAEIDASCKYNPHRVRAWLIGHVFGAVCMVFASCEQDALDSAVDGNLMDAFLSADQNHADENLTSLGNAGELFDVSDFWIGEVSFEPSRDILLIVALARAAESGADTLE